MKKIYFVVIAVATAFVACNKDNEDEGTASGIIDYIEKQELAGGDFVHHNYVINFSYDASSRIAGITETHYIIGKEGGNQEPHGKEVMVITYQGNNATTERNSYYPKDGSWALSNTENDSFTVDSEGKITQFSQGGDNTSHYVYDNGYLTKIQGHDAYSGMDISWSNGDMIKAGDSEMTYSSEENPFADTIDVTVNALNEWYPSPLYFYAVGLFGKHSAHLIKSAGGSEYSFVKDSKGRITMVKHESVQYVIHYK